MHKSLKILSDLATYTKYARYLPDLKRRETWVENVYRYIDMMVKKYPELEEEIYNNAQYIINKEVLPSMRGLQFAGKAIELNNARIYNCSYTAVDHIKVFSEVMFLLLSGCGCGISSQKHHVEKLPELIGPSNKTKKYVIEDSIVGWADAHNVLVESYFFNKPLPRFVFSNIRKKGSILVTSGGRSPGPAPLRACLNSIKNILDKAIEERGRHTKLTTVEVSDIICHEAKAVLAGGIRRASIIILFSYTDNSMMNYKSGDWIRENPQRQMANISSLMLRHKAKRKHFDDLWERIHLSGCGEPAIYWTNSKDLGTNPCGEIGLKSSQFCNLTTINGLSIKSQEDFNTKAKVAAFWGTLQAGFTDFHYLRDVWQETTEKDALIGVSITGVADGEVLKYDLKQAAELVNEENSRVAKITGINEASRTTTEKPEGTSSLVVGSASGIHGREDKYYIRRMRFNKEEPIYGYLKRAIPHLVEDEFFNPEEVGVVSIPVKSPDNAILKSEGAMSLLSRVKKFHDDWVKLGHRKGENTNNVSCTVSIQDQEWDNVGEWMWENRYSYNGIATLPYDNTFYKQAPFESITKEQYEELEKHVRNIDLTKVKEEQDLTVRQQEAACSSGKCEV